MQTDTIPIRTNPWDTGYCHTGYVRLSQWQESQKTAAITIEELPTTSSDKRRESLSDTLVEEEIVSTDSSAEEDSDDNSTQSFSDVEELMRQVKALARRRIKSKIKVEQARKEAEMDRYCGSGNEMDEDTDEEWTSAEEEGIIEVDKKFDKRKRKRAATLEDNSLLHDKCLVYLKNRELTKRLKREEVAAARGEMILT